jgi:hypothetical protein
VGDSVVGVAEVVDDDALVVGDARDRFGFDRKDDDVLMSDVVVSKLARSASGAVCLPRLRKTAVPGT